MFAAFFFHFLNSVGPPTLISCPSDITEISPTGNSLVVSWPAPSAVTSSGALASVQSQTAFSGTPFVIGETCVVIIFIDPQSGLIVVCRFKIIICKISVFFFLFFCFEVLHCTALSIRNFTNSSLKYFGNESPFNESKASLWVLSWTHRAPS